MGEPERDAHVNFPDRRVRTGNSPARSLQPGIALAATFCRHSLRRARFGDPGEYDRYPVPDATSVCAFARIAQYRWQRLWGICARRACSALAGAHWWEIEDDTARQSLLMVLYENYLAKHISADDWVNSLITGLPAEKNALVASTASGYLANVMWEIAPANRAEVEARIYTMTQNHPLPSCRIQLMRLFMQNAISEPMVKKLYILWQQQSDKHLNRQDYTTLAYELAIRMPLESEQILRTQRARIDDPDRLRQFDFISRAAVSDTARLDTLFNSLLAAENRRIEPWTTAVIRYLNHPLREDQSVKYIRPGLEVLEEVQRTGDIFFPKNWAAALLGNHLSSSAYEEVVRFLNERPDYSPLLKNKILQAAYPLYRANN